MCVVAVRVCKFLWVIPGGVRGATFGFAVLLQRTLAAGRFDDLSKVFEAASAL